MIWRQDGVIQKLLDYALVGEEVGANYRANDSRYPGGVYPRDGGASGVYGEGEGVIDGVELFWGAVYVVGAGAV